MAENNQVRAWIVTADMGLGHQRATDPLRHIAEGGLLVAGTPGTSAPQEMQRWNRTRRAYEFLSRTRSVPIIGKPLFGLLDELQKISPFYPQRDLSRPTYQVRLIKKLIEAGTGDKLIEKLKTRPLPMVTSFMIPAMAADMAGYEPLYCIICDAEISRAWVAEKPADSRIRYLVPCGRARMRLKSYGVPEERIFMTGFPMPLELLGNEDLDILRADAAQRLFRLDPNNRFWPLHGLNVKHFLGEANCSPKGNQVLTVTFAVGGAGAQKHVGRQIVESLQPLIEAGEIALNLVAGVRPEVNRYFQELKAMLLPNAAGLRILYHPDKSAYFRLFAQTIRTTDVLWTKPSELSFYCGLGLPIIIAPALGAQEHFNRKWLLEIQAGIPQQDPRYAREWLMDLWMEGRLAEAAWDAFLKARKCGTYKIMELLRTGTMQKSASPLKR